jgi:hypothetical protein
VAKRAEYSGFVECKGCVAVPTRIKPDQSVDVEGNRPGRVFEHHPTLRRNPQVVSQRGERGDRVVMVERGIEQGPRRVGENEIERGLGNGRSDASDRTRATETPHGLSDISRDDPSPVFDAERCDVCPEGNERVANAAPRESASRASAPVPA